MHISSNFVCSGGLFHQNEILKGYVILKIYCIYKFFIIIVVSVDFGF